MERAIIRNRQANRNAIISSDLRLSIANLWIHRPSMLRTAPGFVQCFGIYESSLSQCLLSTVVGPSVECLCGYCQRVEGKLQASEGRLFD